MSWRQICKIQGASKLSLPRWLGNESQRALVVAARQRIFGGVPIDGMTKEGLAIPLGKKSRRILTEPDRDGRIKNLTWPFVRPEIMSGRTYREREKLQAKVQAGIKGIAAGAIEAEKDAKKKKK